VADGCVHQGASLFIGPRSSPDRAVRGADPLWVGRNVLSGVVDDDLIRDESVPGEMAYYDHGNIGLEQLGRAPVVDHVDLVFRAPGYEAHAAGNLMNGPRQDKPFEAERLSFEHRVLRDRLVDGLEIVERASEPLRQEERDSRDEHDPEGRQTQRMTSPPPGTAVCTTARATV